MFVHKFGAMGKIFGISEFFGGISLFHGGGSCTPGFSMHSRVNATRHLLKCPSADRSSLANAIVAENCLRELHRILGIPQSAGLAWSRRARWKHGLDSAEALAEQKRVRELLAQSRELLKQMQAD